MDANLEFLKEICALPGPSGYEDLVSKRIEDEFRLKADTVWRDEFFNTFARMGGDGPTVLISGHMDEIALMVTRVYDDGFLSFTSIGGVDPRILPAQEVTVHGSEAFYGVIGAKPPHVLSAADRLKSMSMEDLYVDTGLFKDVIGKIRVGDIITFNSPVTQLAGSIISGSSLDDRMGVAILLEAMDHLRDTNLFADAVFCSTVQEEIGVKGATIAAYNVTPDMAIAIDVCHAHTPDTSAPQTKDMDKIAIAVGPYMSNPMVAQLMKVAKQFNIKFSKETTTRGTGTDGDAFQISGDGVPLCVISIPQRYMHTTVETLDWEVVKNCGLLIANFLRAIDDGWEEWICY